MIMLNLDKNDSSMILNLTKNVPALKRLKGMLNWEPHPIHANSKKDGFDLDIFIFMLDDAGRLHEVNDAIYFNRKWNDNKSIGVPVDNQTGEGDDDEYFIMDIPKLPANRSKFPIFTFLHEAAKRKQNFGMISNAFFDIINDETGETLVRYSLNQEYGAETALHVGNLVRNSNGDYEFHPVGEGAVAEPNEVMQSYLNG